MAKVLDLLDNVVVQLELYKRVETEQVIDPKYVFERKQQDLNVLEVNLFTRFFSSRLACRAQFTPAVQPQLEGAGEAKRCLTAPPTPRWHVMRWRANGMGRHSKSALLSSYGGM